jgi:hypothetical protein
MRTIESGSAARRGYYFGTRSWRLQPVARDGDRLAGTPGERFVRIPLLLALALTPVLGALFVVFLPVIGFWLAAVALSRPAMRLVRGLATRFAATVEPGWQPGEAHLTGKRGAAGPPPVEAEEDPLDELEREIAALRAARGRAA